MRYTSARMTHPDDPEAQFPELDAKIVGLYAPVFENGFAVLAQLASGERTL